MFLLTWSCCRCAGVCWGVLQGVFAPNERLLHAVRLFEGQVKGAGEQQHASTAMRRQLQDREQVGGMYWRSQQHTESWAVGPCGAKLAAGPGRARPDNWMGFVRAEVNLETKQQQQAVWLAAEAALCRQDAQQRGNVELPEAAAAAAAQIQRCSWGLCWQWQQGRSTCRCLSCSCMASAQPAHGGRAWVL